MEKEMKMKRKLGLFKGSVARVILFGVLYWGFTPTTTRHTTVAKHLTPRCWGWKQVAGSLLDSALQWV